MNSKFHMLYIKVYKLLSCVQLRRNRQGCARTGYLVLKWISAGQLAKQTLSMNTCCIWIQWSFFRVDSDILRTCRSLDENSCGWQIDPHHLGIRCRLALLGLSKAKQAKWEKNLISCPVKNAKKRKIKDEKKTKKALIWSSLKLFAYHPF